MTSFNFNETGLDQLITHKVGNKHRDEGLLLSNELTIVDEETVEYLTAYFLQDFKLPEFYGFTHSVSLDMNELYSLVKSIFEDHDNFTLLSKSIAKLLYDSSEHPNIKEGELNIAFLNTLILREEVVEGIGIFKSENTSPFIKMLEKKDKYSINHDFGFEIKKIDKACIIFNTNKKNGYVVMIIDNVNRSNDARYWKDDFLKLAPLNDDYYNTKEFLTITKDFVTKQLPEEFDIDNTDRIQLLNRSIEYFKTNDKFDKEEFEEHVFQDEKVIDSFRRFDESTRSENNIELMNNFDISGHAVKKQSRVFKSVLKLDKNFHVYIHGDKNLIEKGVERDGRKFYKIYYDNEE